MSRSSESILNNITDYLRFISNAQLLLPFHYLHHGIINSATIFTPRPLRHPVPMTGGGSRQQSATTRDAQAPKRKEMRLPTMGGGGGGVRHGPSGFPIAG